MKKKLKPLKVSRFNKKIVLSSIIALLCLILGFIIHWIFIIPAIIILILNQKELMKKKD